MPQQQPDSRLRSLLVEAGWSGQQLAQKVNALGAEAGLTLRYDRTSVAHWLAGSTPRPPVAELIAEAFSRQLNRRIEAAVHGVPARGDVPGDPRRPENLFATFGGSGEADAAARLVELVAGRRRAPGGGVYSVAALAVPGWIQASTAPPSPSGATRAVRSDRIGREHAVAAEAMTRVFSDADCAYGGGRTVGALAAYLAVDVSPRLRARASPAVRQAMLRAATELAYLCAFMCFDQERHPAAQQYYTVALQLSAENNDPAAYATTLRALSVQANHLGHHRQAIDLADAAVRTAPATSPPGTRAFLHGQAAVAAAGIGDRRTALAHLTRAESLLERGATAGATSGAYHQASLGHQRAAVLEALGDAQGAAEALTASLRHRPAAERRARALTLAALAQMHLRQGRLEPAVATWQKFLEDYPHLESGRARTAHATLRATLRPHQRTPVVAAVWAQSAAMGR